MEPAEIMKDQIEVVRVESSKIEEVDFNNVPFGKVFSDHMFSADYNHGVWTNFKIEPYSKISVSPSISALHYGQLIFEGMKAYRNINGQSVLFRPNKNFERFNISAKRMAMPELPTEIFRNGLKTLLDIDRDWIPDNSNGSLYIRPFMFATDDYVGIRVSESYKFMIITCPVGPYYEHPVRVKVADHYVRAFKGGTGFAKAAGNYAATLLPVTEANKEDYEQILWLDGCEFKYIHEIGTMNVFFQIGDTIITPSTESGEILDGVTRDSVITLLKDKGYEVEERDLTIQEVEHAYDNGTLRDAFGAGTAATITHISLLGYKNRKLMLPPVSERDISNMLKRELKSIHRGMMDDKFGWLETI